MPLPFWRPAGQRQRPQPSQKGRRNVHLVAVAAVVAAPAAVRGPQYVLDDWFLLANARFDGWWRALPADLFRARPGSGVVYALTIGLLGRHPMVAFVVQAALVLLAAVLLRTLLVRFLGDPLATATALVWLWLPNHGSLLQWTTATPITVALVLLLGGLVLLDDERNALAAIALGAAVLCYEATAPAAALGLVAVPVLRRRPWARPAAVGAAVLAPVGVWMLANVPTVKDEGLARTADLSLVLPAHVGWGVLPDGPVAVAGGALACVVVVLLAVDGIRRRTLHVEAAMVVAGVTTIVVGTLPFVRYFYAPLGAGDRVNVVAAVGTALVWTGLGAWLANRLPRRAMTTVAVAVLAAMGVASWQGSMAWADAADDATRILDDLPAIEQGEVVLVERPPVRRNVTAFADRSNITGAVQLEAGRRDVDVRFRPDR